MQTTFTLHLVEIPGNVLCASTNEKEMATMRDWWNRVQSRNTTIAPPATMRTIEVPVEPAT